MVVAALLAVLLNLWPAPARAQVAVQEWVQYYNYVRFGTPQNSDPRAMALDSNGDVIVMGCADFAGGVTIKYSPAGVPLWTNISLVAWKVAVDADRNVFLAGYSSPPGSYATVKLSSAGVALWTNFYRGSDDKDPSRYQDQPSAMAVDAAGSVIVTGHSYRNGATDSDYATIKYSNAGLPLWTNRYNGLGNSNDYAAAIGVDASGNVFVTGSTDGQGAVTIKYSSAGASLWTNRFGGALAVDANGDVIATGYSDGGADGYGYATVKYSSAGVPLWTNFYFAPPWATPVAIAVDSSNNVLVTGKAYGGPPDNGPDYVTIKYSSAGAALWTNRYNGPGGPGNADDTPRGIAVDAQGNAYVTGDTLHTISGGWDAAATVAYSASGVPIWTNLFYGQPNSSNAGAAIAANAGGDVYIGVGTYTSYGAFATVKYSVPRRPIPLGIQRLAHEVVLSWTNAIFSLQSAPAATGTYTNIPGATSPWTNPITAGSQFFRLIAN